MRIVVISDSHRRSGNVSKILDAQQNARHVFFLGDVTGDIDELMKFYPDKVLHTVSGNCDIFSSYPSTDIAELYGHRIFFTHGHTLGVKYGTERLISAARAAGCDIALYGHTHVSKILYEDGLYVVNPGSCAETRDGGKSYAVIDIEKNGVMPIIIKI